MSQQSRNRSVAFSLGSGRSRSAASSRSRQRSFGSSKVTSNANNTLNNATKYKRKGKIGTRHLKTVRVGRALRAKIKTVVQDKGTQGSRLMLWNDHFLMGPPATVAQRHFHFDYLQALIGMPHVYFTPLQTMNSAAIMFGGKTPVHDYTVTAGNFGDSEDAVFDITSQKVTYNFKNNSQRHFDLVITVLTPKNNTDADVEGTIDNAITVDTTSGRWAGSATQGPSKFNLITNWQASPTLKTYYKMEKTLIKIDPGASVSHVVRGWSGRFNWKKSMKEDQGLLSVHWKYPKNDTKFVVVDAIPNIVGITSATNSDYAGRWVNSTGTNGAGILMEIKEEIFMDAPMIKPVDSNRQVAFQENYTSSVALDSRTFGVQDPDDEGRGLYAPQDS